MIYFQIPAIGFRITTGTSLRMLEMLKPSSFGNQIPKFLLEANLLASGITTLMIYLGRYNDLNHMFCPLQGLLILTDHQYFIFKDKSTFDTDKKTQIGMKNGTLNFTKIIAVRTTVPFRLFPGNW